MGYWMGYWLLSPGDNTNLSWPGHVYKERHWLCSSILSTLQGCKGGFSDSLPFPSSIALALKTLDSRSMSLIFWRFYFGSFRKFIDIDLRLRDSKCERILMSPHRKVFGTSVDCKCLFVVVLRVAWLLIYCGPSIVASVQVELSKGGWSLVVFNEAWPFKETGKKTAVSQVLQLDGSNDT